MAKAWGIAPKGVAGTTDSLLRYLIISMIRGTFSPDLYFSVAGGNQTDQILVGVIQTSQTDNFCFEGILSKHSLW